MYSLILLDALLHDFIATIWLKYWRCGIKMPIGQSTELNDSVVCPTVGERHNMYHWPALSKESKSMAVLAVQVLFVLYP